VLVSRMFVTTMDVEVTKSATSSSLCVSASAYRNASEFKQNRVWEAEAGSGGR
jgi:hypothetical protein